MVLRLGEVNATKLKYKGQRVIVNCHVSPGLKRLCKGYYRVFSHDVTAAILVSQNNETAAMKNDLSLGKTHFLVEKIPKQSKIDFKLYYN